MEPTLEEVRKYALFIYESLLYKNKGQTQTTPIGTATLVDPEFTLGQIGDGVTYQFIFSLNDKMYAIDVTHSSYGDDWQEFSNTYEVSQVEKTFTVYEKAAA